MIEKWMADVVGEMHLYGISRERLASEVGWHKSYLSSVLNGHEQSAVAEAKLRDAIQRIVATESDGSSGCVR